MEVNQQQSEAWNGPESAHYVDQADRYDRQLEPITDALFAAARLESNLAVLDVGCGSGASTLRAARLARTVVGADISAPLLELAADRALAAEIDNVEFVVADAQTYPFGEGGFDVLISQFGLMFFDDPVGAFANLRRALAPGGRVVFVCWQGLEANEWVRLVGDAVAQHVALPDLGGRSGGPGMFALKHENEIASLLQTVGFSHTVVDPLAPTILLGGGGSLAESVDFLLSTGIVRGLLGHLEPAARSSAVEAIRAALADRYEDGTGVRLGAGAWLVTANA